MLLMQFGNMSSRLTKYNTRLFAEKVMPKLKPLFCRVGEPLVAAAAGPPAARDAAGLPACAAVAAE